MNQIETELTLADVDSDIDIETLMLRIREHINGDASNSVAVVNANGRSMENGLGEALKAQAAFNRAMVETMTRICGALGHQRTQIETQHAELQNQRTHLEQQLLALRNDFGQFTAQEPSRRREVVSRMEGDSKRFADQLATMEQQSLMARQMMQAQITAWFGGLGSLSARMEEHAGDLAGLTQAMQEQLELLRIRVRRAERQGSEAGIDKASQPDGETTPTPSVPETIVPHQVSQPQKAGGAGALALNGKTLNRPFDYFLFEHEFRGARSDIKQRQLAYLELFRGRENVLDLGCGRGEFVELLSESGIPIVGVDQDADMVAECSERGLRVVQADVFEYLKTIPDASLDGIFAAQLVEHLTPEQVLTLVELCQFKLKTGGVVVLETVNPHCALALGNFYLDPTHVRPLPPKLLAFMLTQSAFTLQTIQFSSPVPESGVSPILAITTDWDTRVHAYQDYAVIAARK